MKHLFVDKVIMCISLWAMVAETVSYTKSTEKLCNKGPVAPGCVFMELLRCLKNSEMAVRSQRKFMLMYNFT